LSLKPAVRLPSDHEGASFNRILGIELDFPRWNNSLLSVCRRLQSARILTRDNNIQDVGIAIDDIQLVPDAAVKSAFLKVAETKQNITAAHKYR
jgi:hypothetical protein